MNTSVELKKLPQWVCHRNKVPFNPVTGAPAKAGQRATWASFKDCVNALDSGGYDGIGFEFNNNGIVGIDFDHVVTNDDSLSEEAVEIVSCWTAIQNTRLVVKVFISSSRVIFLWMAGRKALLKCIKQKGILP